MEHVWRGELEWTKSTNQVGGTEIGKLEHVGEENEDDTNGFVRKVSKVLKEWDWYG
jgi:hypothetical protein